MKPFESWFGQREFCPPEEISQYVSKSKNYDVTSEDPATAKTLLLFETSSQHTWLVTTKERLYCILDDVRKPEPHINWSMSRNKIIEGEELKLALKARHKTERTGLVDFGERHKNWLYSKRLFAGVPVERSVGRFIQDSMGQP